MPSVASSPLHCRCKATRLILREMTVAVSNNDSSLSQLQLFNLHILRGRFMLSFEQHTEGRPSIFDMQRCWSEPATPNSTALATEHLRYLSVFADFITVLLKKLDRQIWESFGSNEDLGFKVLWGMMFDACTVFLVFPQPWPDHHIPETHPVYKAMRGIMSFLTPLVCPSSDSVRAWAPPLGRAVTANENRVMLTPAFITFDMFCSDLSTNQVALPSSLRTLPPAFVQTLCMLASQRFDAPIPDPQLVGQMLSGLARSLAFCVDVLQTTNSESDISLLRTPTVLQVAKRGHTFLTSQQVPQGTLDQIQRMIDILSRS